MSLPRPLSTIRRTDSTGVPGALLIRSSAEPDASVLAALDGGRGRASSSGGSPAEISSATGARRRTPRTPSLSGSTAGSSTVAVEDLLDVAIGTVSGNGKGRSPGGEGRRARPSGNSGDSKGVQEEPRESLEELEELLAVEEGRVQEGCRLVRPVVVDSNHHLREDALGQRSLLLL